MRSLNEYRAKKNGEITPLSLIENVKNHIEREDIRELVCITVSNDGTLKVGFSGMNNFYLMGMMEAAKDELKLLIEEE